MSLDAYPHQVGGSVTIAVTGTDHPAPKPDDSASGNTAPLPADPASDATRDDDKAPTSE